MGYRVRFPRGVQFRRWASTVLKEFLLKGFVMDDERLRNPDGRPDYFDGMLSFLFLRHVRVFPPGRRRVPGGGISLPRTAAACRPYRG